MRKTRASLPAYAPHDPEAEAITKGYHRSSTKSLSRDYLMCLASAHAGILDPMVPVLHLREAKNYRRLLGLEERQRQRKRPAA